MSSVRVNSCASLMPYPGRNRLMGHILGEQRGRRAVAVFGFRFSVFGFRFSVFGNERTGHQQLCRFHLPTTLHPQLDYPPRMGNRRQTIGIIGAGQLARMLIEAATPLDIEIALLAASPTDGAARIWPDVAIGSPDDAETVAAFARACDVVTFDHELVPEPVLSRLE